MSDASAQEKRSSSSKWARAVEVAVQRKEEQRWHATIKEASEGGKTNWYASLKPWWGRPSWLGADGSHASGGDGAAVGAAWRLAAAERAVPSNSAESRPF